MGSEAAARPNDKWTAALATTAPIDCRSGVVELEPSGSNAPNADVQHVTWTPETRRSISRVSNVCFETKRNCSRDVDAHF